MKPIFVITSTNMLTMEQRGGIREKLDGYHVIFLHGDKDNCQLFSIKETIELKYLKQLQEYLDNQIK